MVLQETLFRALALARGVRTTQWLCKAQPWHASGDCLPVGAPLQSPRGCQAVLATRREEPTYASFFRSPSGRASTRILVKSFVSSINIKRLKSVVLPRG